MGLRGRGGCRKFLMFRPLFRLVAFSLILVWGPATMCCAREAAGWGIGCSADCCHESGSAHAEPAEGCNVIEDGAYQTTIPALKVAPPIGELGLGVSCTRHFEPELETEHAGYVSEIVRTRDWVPVWQFERRAAAPAHAPDWLIA